MDWTDFQLLFWFFQKSDRVLYLGTPDLLKFILLNAKEVYYVSPEPIDMINPKLKTFLETPYDFDMSKLPDKVDTLVNYLPLNMVTSFKVMGRYIDLLPMDRKALIKIDVPKTQAQYANLMLKDLLSQFGLSLVSQLEIEDNSYVIVKKLN